MAPSKPQYKRHVFAINNLFRKAQGDDDGNLGRTFQDRMSRGKGEAYGCWRQSTLRRDANSASGVVGKSG